VTQPQPGPGVQEASTRSPRGSKRRWFAGALVVLTVVAITASTLAVWVRATVYDTDRFMEVVEPALTDPAFYAALSAYVSDTALEALELDARVAASLDRVDLYLSEALVAAIDPDPGVLERLRAFDRPTLGTLAPSISAALEARVVGAVDRFITSEEFQSRLPGLVREAHAGGMALVTDDLEALPNVYIEDGDVRADLIPVVVDALQEVAPELQQYLPDVTLPAVVADRVQPGREQLRAELERSLDAELPEDFGQVTLMEQSALIEVQQIARQIDRLVWGTVLLAIILFAAAIVVSPNRRRTFIHLAFGVVAGLAAAMLVVRRLEEAVLSQITDPDGLQAVRSLFGALALNLRTVTVLVAVVAMAVGILAYLSERPAGIAERDQRAAGITAPSVDGRHFDRWLADHADELRIAGFVTALGVLLLLLGVDLFPLLVVGALLGLYQWAIVAARRRAEALDLVATTTDGSAEPPRGEGRSASDAPGAAENSPAG
jgi:hypothetical protein